jgi:aryl-alcohol dehydrogenase-like predicted oxidoreductase
MNAFKQFVQQGKMKYITLAECSNDTIRRAYQIHPISAVQVEYSPFTFDIEKQEIGLFKTCQELAISIVRYSPLDRRMLTGQYKSPDDFQENLQLIEILTKFAEKKGCATGQLRAQGEQLIVIAGTTKIKNLEENLVVAQIKLN